MARIGTVDLSGNNPFPVAVGPSTEQHSSPGAFAITPSDNPENNFAQLTRGVYVGSDAGNVAIVHSDDTVVTYTAVPVGTILPVQAKRVNATGTTSTALVGMK